MDCNLDMVRGFARLFGPEGSANGGDSGSEVRLTNGSPLETKPSVVLGRSLQATSNSKL
jgi:hypothetical protein